jgi:hypothetical protein
MAKLMSTVTQILSQIERVNAPAAEELSLLV